jgi:hypothetical protein
VLDQEIVYRSSELEEAKLDPLVKEEEVQVDSLDVDAS